MYEGFAAVCRAGATVSFAALSHREADLRIRRRRAPGSGVCNECPPPSSSEPCQYGRLILNVPRGGDLDRRCQADVL